MTETDHLAIEHACARLIALYANYNDAGEWQALADLYCEDGRFARPSAPDDWIVGRDAILASLLARPARRGHHLCTNIVIDIVSGNEARGTTAIGLFVDGKPPMVGSFHDVFKRTGSGWKFAERRGSMAY